MFRRSRDFFTDILRQTDLVLLALCAAASLFGILMVASATRYMHTWRLVAVQSAALLLGVILYLLVSQVDLNDLSKYWKWIFLTGIIFILLLVTPLGIEDNTGNRAWLDFPVLPVKVQPAEIVKITFIILLARQLALLQEKKDLTRFSNVIQPTAHAGIMFLFYYVISKDAGSGLVYLFVFVCMAFAGGFALRWIFLGLGGAVGGFLAAWNFNLLRGDWYDRIKVILDHSYQPEGKGWQQTRGMLALGSGKLTGQGLFNGTQTQSLYRSSLPERQTDFIFCVCGEELGFIGCLLVIVLLLAYFFFKYRNLRMVQGIVKGLRPGVVALIAASGYGLMANALWGDGAFSFAALDWFAVALFAAALVVLRKWKPNPIYVMVACGVVGALFYGLV